METFFTYLILGILTILVSISLVYLLWYGLKQLSTKGLIKTDFTAWSKRRRRFLGIVGAFIIYLILYNGVFEPYQDNWGSTRAERQLEYPDDDFLSNPKVQAFQAINIDAPPSEVWKWIVQLGGHRAGWYSHAWAENLFGLDIYNKYELRPEWQSMEVGQLLPYNGRGDCGIVTEVVKDKYFVHRWDPAVSDDDFGQLFYASTGDTIDLHNWKIFPKGYESSKYYCTWLFYIKELPDGKSRLISRADNHWTTSNPFMNAAFRTFIPLMHNLMAIETLTQIKDCAEGNASEYENTPLPEGGVH